MHTNTLRQFGRKRSPFDHRDIIIKNVLKASETFRIWPIHGVLDQEDTPHCGGFAMAHFGNCAPVMDRYNNDVAHAFYYSCKFLEGEDNQENGVYTRSTADVLYKQGIIHKYGWLATVEDAKRWVLKFGPIIVGSVWLSSMIDIFQSDGTMYVGGEEVGGHLYLMTGYQDGKFIFINSWGKEWGLDGHFKIDEDDFRRLMMLDGEMIAAIEKTTPINQW